MPTGTGVEVLSNIPAQPFVTDPHAFFAMTERTIINAEGSRQAAAPGGNVGVRLKQAGIVSKLQITFEGTATVVTAAATTGVNWPYGVLAPFKLTAGAGTDLFNCDGVDLHVLRFARYPAYDERVDQFPGSVGGGDSLGVGTHDLYLTWEVPIAVDDTTLIGSLFAQSAAMVIEAILGTAPLADLFSANPGNVTIAGTWRVQETLFEIPVDAQNQLVVPDLTKLHQFHALATPHAQAGEARTLLVRSAGQLNRLFVSVKRAAHNRLKALPSAAAADSIDAFRLEYGAGERPLVFDPAASLLSINNQHYGAVLPYDYLALDFVRENPPRDILFLLGVTELAVVPTINAGVTMSAGSVRVVQETLS